MGDWLRKIPPHLLDVEAKLATMDANRHRADGAEHQRSRPRVVRRGRPGGRPDRQRLRRRHRPREHPTRFFGLCVLPLQDMKASLAELDRCVQQLGMKGILLYTNLAGKFPGRAGVSARSSRAPCELRRARSCSTRPSRSTTELVKGYEMTSALGNMFDNTIALTRLIMSGILDRISRAQARLPAPRRHAAVHRRPARSSDARC